VHLYYPVKIDTMLDGHGEQNAYDARDLDSIMIHYHVVNLHDYCQGYQAGYDDYWHRAQIANSNVNNNTAENNPNVKINRNGKRVEINQNNGQASNSPENSNVDGYGYNGGYSRC
jgi:hypothetical protein